MQRTSLQIQHRSIEDESVDHTVVIPAYRGKSTISDCLRSVLVAGEGLRCEVVVVESSGDGAAELIRREFPDVRLVVLMQPATAGAARNRGVALARGKSILFVDQD